MDLLREEKKYRVGKRDPVAFHIKQSSQFQRIRQKEPDSFLQFSFHRDYFSQLSALPGLSQPALMIKQD
ncbi:hypothetical protein GRJ2_001456800 [Grus japonensis]|uniref:Uncharacterized protein n=1 Tax=Grus japonensis TaxID=30415 RepID=A0ABC9WXY1_GRUJA